MELASKKTIAIMQPYIFPYIGYFNLVSSSDIFIFLDDVNYINKGWINRNYILANGIPNRLTIPLENSSQNKKINNLRIKNYSYTKKQILNKLHHAYCKSKNYSYIITLIENILDLKNQYISELAIKSVTTIFEFLGIEKQFIKSSDLPSNTKGCKGFDRLIKILALYDSKNYVNLPGGKSLYTKNEFKERGFDLSFIKPSNAIYPQLNNKGKFVPNLSIIDLLMNMNVQNLKATFQSYNLE